MSRVLQISEMPRRAQPPRDLDALLHRSEAGAQIIILPCIRREPLIVPERATALAERG